MKTANEIHSMISDLMDYIDNPMSKQRHEEICCAIDALLWVVDDDCGDFITVEHWKNEPEKCPKAEIYVEVDGGMVQNVYTNNYNIDFDVTLCDRDCIGDEDSEESCEELDRLIDKNKLWRIW